MDSYCNPVSQRQRTSWRTLARVLSRPLQKEYARGTRRASLYCTFVCTVLGPRQSQHHIRAWNYWGEGSVPLCKWAARLHASLMYHFEAAHLLQWEVTAPSLRFLRTRSCAWLLHRKDFQELERNSPCQTRCRLKKFKSEASLADPDTCQPIHKTAFT